MKPDKSQKKNNINKKIQQYKHNNINEQTGFERDDCAIEHRYCDDCPISDSGKKLLWTKQEIYNQIGDDWVNYKKGCWNKQFLDADEVKRIIEKYYEESKGSFCSEYGDDEMFKGFVESLLKRLGLK